LAQSGSTGKKILVGTCGFSASRRKIYQDLDVVELQFTFYDPRDEKLLSKLASEKPEGFEFTVKAWMLVTHAYNKRLWRRLKGPVPGDPEKYGYFQDTEEVEWAWSETLKAAERVGARIIVLQTPASFRPTTENIGRLERFLEKHRGDVEVLAWEPRGEWWSKRELLASISDRFDLVIAGDFLRGRTPPACREIAYARLHGLGGGEVNYKYKYTSEDLKRLADIVRGLCSPTVYVLFNNVYSYVDAVEFKKLLSGGPG